MTLFGIQLQDRKTFITADVSVLLVLPNPTVVHFQITTCKSLRACGLSLGMSAGLIPYSVVLCPLVAQGPEPNSCARFQISGAQVPVGLTARSPQAGIHRSITG